MVPALHRCVVGRILGHVGLHGCVQLAFCSRGQHLHGHSVHAAICNVARLVVVAIRSAAAMVRRAILWWLDFWRSNVVQCSFSLRFRQTFHRSSRRLASVQSPLIQASFASLRAVLLQPSVEWSTACQSRRAAYRYGRGDSSGTAVGWSGCLFLDTASARVIYCSHSPLAPRCFLRRYSSACKNLSARSAGKRSELSTPRFSIA